MEAHRWANQLIHCTSPTGQHGKETKHTVAIRKATGWRNLKQRTAVKGGYGAE
jgi:hypothetical protein